MGAKNQDSVAMPFGRRTRCGLAKENACKYANTHRNDVVPAEDEDVDVAHALSWCVTEKGWPCAALYIVDRDQVCSYADAIVRVGTSCLHGS